MQANIKSKCLIGPLSVVGLRRGTVIRIPVDVILYLDKKSCDFCVSHLAIFLLYSTVLYSVFYASTVTGYPDIP